jgi:hypothetical protein
MPARQKSCVKRYSIDHQQGVRESLVARQHEWVRRRVAHQVFSILVKCTGPESESWLFLRVHPSRRCSLFVSDTIK